MEQPLLLQVGGEFVETVAPRKDFCIVMVKPETFGISTADAYRRVDRWLESRGADLPEMGKKEMIRQYLNLSPAEWQFYNTFFETFKNQHKPLEFISKLLYDAGAVFTGLSGSGSTVYGVFLSQEKADSAYGQAVHYFPFTERIIPLDGIPEAVVI